jgi:hypothetical protein
MASSIAITKQDAGEHRLPQRVPSSCRRHTRWMRYADGHELLKTIGKVRQNEDGFMPF